MQSLLFVKVLLVGYIKCMLLALQNLSKPNRHHFSHGDVLEWTSLWTCQSTSPLSGERLEGVLSVPVLSFHKR